MHNKWLPLSILRFPLYDTWKSTLSGTLSWQIVTRGIRSHLYSMFGQSEPLPHITIISGFQWLYDCGLSNWEIPSTNYHDHVSTTQIQECQMKHCWRFYNIKHRTQNIRSNIVFMNPCAYTGLAALQMTRKKGLTGYYFEPCSANAELYNHFSKRERKRAQDFTYRQLTGWRFVYDQDNVLRAFGWQIYVGILSTWNDSQIDLPKNVTWKILLSRIQFGLKLHTNWL